VLAAFGLVLVMASGTARGESPASAEAAASFLSAFRDQGSAMLADPGLGSEDRRAAVRRLLTTSFDLQTIGRFVLGKYWRRASLQERAEFRRLFEGYIAANIARRLDDFGGETMELGQARLERPGLAVVASRVLQAEGAPVAVLWRLRHGKAGWRIIDVVVEGISLALAQRAELTSILRNNGGRVAPLLAKLRQAMERDHSLASLRLVSAG
jgi:phospholipid transport system substrate-binding protein